jgi:hypothetical protein
MPSESRAEPCITSIATQQPRLLDVYAAGCLFFSRYTSLEGTQRFVQSIVSTTNMHIDCRSPAPPRCPPIKFFQGMSGNIGCMSAHDNRKESALQGV